MKVSRLVILAALVLAATACAQGYTPSDREGGDGQQARFYDGGPTIQTTMPDEQRSGGDRE